MILLPPQVGAVPLPPAPHDPPDLADVVCAKYYEKSIEVATGVHIPDGPTPNDAARADIYKTQVVLALLADGMFSHYSKRVDD